MEYPYDYHTSTLMYEIVTYFSIDSHCKHVPLYFIGKPNNHPLTSEFMRVVLKPNKLPEK